MLSSRPFDGRKPGIFWSGYASSAVIQAIECVMISYKKLNLLKRFTFLQLLLGILRTDSAVHAEKLLFRCAGCRRAYR
jgi:hypothetical protein